MKIISIYEFPSSNRSFRNCFANRTAGETTIASRLSQSKIDLFVEKLADAYQGLRKSPLFRNIYRDIYFILQWLYFLRAKKMSPIRFCEPLLRRSNVLFRETARRSFHGETRCSNMKVCLRIDSASTGGVCLPVRRAVLVNHRRAGQARERIASRKKFAVRSANALRKPRHSQRCLEASAAAARNHSWGEEKFLASMEKERLRRSQGTR